MGDTNLDNVIDFLMRNDTNVYGTPPAASNAVKNLQRIQFSKDIKREEEETTCECSVCKEEFKENEEEIVKMPC